MLSIRVQNTGSQRVFSISVKTTGSQWVFSICVQNTGSQCVFSMLFFEEHFAQQPSAATYSTQLSQKLYQSLAICAWNLSCVFLRAFLSPFFTALLEELPYDLEFVVTKSENHKIGLFWLSRNICKCDVVQGIHRKTNTHWNVAQNFRSVWVEITGTSLR